jgi:uncharacterized FlgJ-related protein
MVNCRILLLMMVLTSFISQTFGKDAEASMSRLEYVELWKQTAIDQMNLNRIPASITLAQGILESGSGNSKLAREGNNHFGIKCHGWEGKTMYLDDDKPNECFRVYESGSASYEDHSAFLKKYKRYESLFQLAETDYAGWARGLQQAGYATSQKYAALLIELIEDLKLFTYDSNRPQEATSPTVLAETSGASKGHKVELNTYKRKFIVAVPGDTYYRLVKEFGISFWQLYKYNEFKPTKDCLVPGDIVYLQPKKIRGKEKWIRMERAITLRDFSQKEGLRLDKLMKRNRIDSPDELLSVGEKVILR